MKARRVGSVCSGTFILAALGLIDGRRVATHWEACNSLTVRYPGITVDPEALYVVDGKIWTSAGVTTGIDMALAMVEADCGADVANAIARRLVRLPITVLGGAGSFADLGRLIAACGVVGASAGSLFVFKGVYRAVLISYPWPVLTVSTLPSFAALWLLPRLGRFMEQHPQIAVTMHTSNTLVDLERDEVDLAIRWGSGRWASSITFRTRRPRPRRCCSRAKAITRKCRSG